ncbi:SCO family protein [Legionella fairfieldensis]|uniref:SCO family protein n=1 Tax=Legionella fairfieldensis TaxID=45064 RepID=UPI00048D3ED9|nr:SCO family protein [Legionella fairfieldensis]
MSTRNNHINRTVIALIAFMALIAGLFISQHFHQKKKIDPSEFNGTLLEQPRGIKTFSLTGVDKKSFNNASLQGHWTMMFFGFTSCGYVCPTTMAELGKMYHLLEEKGVELPRVVMISVDPDRDSLDKLAHYVQAFNAHFYGARGDDNMLKQMTREMGIAYTKVAMANSEDATNYDIEHSGAIMLFNPKGELNAFFTTPHQAALLANDYQLLVSVS